MNGINALGGAQGQMDHPSRGGGSLNHPGKHLGQLKQAGIFEAMGMHPSQLARGDVSAIVQQHINNLVSGGDAQNGERATRTQAPVSDQATQLILNNMQSASQSATNSMDFMSRYNALSTAF